MQTKYYQIPAIGFIADRFDRLIDLIGWFDLIWSIWLSDCTPQAPNGALSTLAAVPIYSSTLYFRVGIHLSCFSILLHELSTTDCCIYAPSYESQLTAGRAAGAGASCPNPSLIFVQLSLPKTIRSAAYYTGNDRPQRERERETLLYPQSKNRI